ncbi:MAG: hypothetical protein K2R98_23390 [Gemmataceae bacterium]|nr:hypothetical protein [Gemmataceae bacterium]
MSYQTYCHFPWLKSMPSVWCGENLTRLLSGALIVLLLVPVPVLGALNLKDVIWSTSSSLTGGPFVSTPSFVSSKDSSVATFALQSVPSSAPYSGTITFTATDFKGNGNLNGFTAGIANLLGPPHSGVYTLNIGTTGANSNNMFGPTSLLSSDVTFTVVSAGTGTTVSVRFVFSSFSYTAPGTPFTITLN